MPLWSMAVFGSRARGDDDPKSDIDILLITSGKKPRLVNKDRLSFSLYPSKWLLKKAQAGDLFVFISCVRPRSFMIHVGISLACA